MQLIDQADTVTLVVWLIVGVLINYADDLL